MNRRTFIKSTTTTSAAAIISGPMINSSLASSRKNETVNVAIIGVRGRGKDHLRALSKIPDVNIAAICDIDERLIPEMVSEVEKLTGRKPTIFKEYRNVLENKDINAVTLATPNHWHALQTIWACQAGKDVYVEKPVSHTLEEGRKMVEAARKYNRIVQTGTQIRSNSATRQAMEFLHSGELGKMYMARALCLKPRDSIGHKADTAIPNGVDWNTFLGPAPNRPFNENRFHYKWHWFWDTGNGDLGNQGIHQADVGRWAMQLSTHPIKIQGIGKYMIYDSDQETPNIQQIQYEYANGEILQIEVRGLGTNSEAGIRIGDLVFGSKGWMSIEEEDSGLSKTFLSDIKLQESGFSVYKETEGPIFSNENSQNPVALVNHFTNFLDCVRSRNWQALNADILQGHLSTSLCHLGNIACRLQQPLQFDPETERFIGNNEADHYLTKEYRKPFELPEKI